MIERIADRLPHALHSRSINSKQPSEALLNTLSQRSHGAPYEYSRTLVGHFGCVNAIALSSGENNLLASGGDDTQVYVRLVSRSDDRSGTSLLIRKIQNLFVFSKDMYRICFV